MTELTWECSCGHVEYGTIPPDECPNCFKIDTFTQLPEELAVEREKDKQEEDEEFEMQKITKLPKSKPSKPKLKKPRRKKRK